MIHSLSDDIKTTLNFTAIGCTDRALEIRFVGILWLQYNMPLTFYFSLNRKPA